MAESEKLSAAQRAKIRRLSAPKELAPDEEGGELNIVPFLDIIMNVLMFVLATVTTVVPGDDRRRPRPRRAARQRAGHADAQPHGHRRSRRVQREGEGGERRPWMPRHGLGDHGPEVERRTTTTRGCNNCVVTVKKEAPEEVQDETNVTISANPNIPYQVIVSTIDAFASDDDGKDLFPDVQFGLPR